MNYLRSIFVLTAILICFYAKAQSHFYTLFKMPLTEYVSAVVNGKNASGENYNKETDGISLTAGYALKIAPNFYNEMGIDYLILNKATNTSLSNKTTLENRNSVFAFQTAPTYRQNIDANEEVFLTIGLAFNCQKIYAKGYFIDSKNSSISTDLKNSNWFLSMQPRLGIDFKKSDKLGFRFGISYAHYDWSKIENNLEFKNSSNLTREPHKTSNLFFSGGFIF